MIGCWRIAVSETALLDELTNHVKLIPLWQLFAVCNDPYAYDRLNRPGMAPEARLTTVPRGAQQAWVARQGGIPGGCRVPLVAISVVIWWHTASSLGLKLTGDFGVKTKKRTYTGGVLCPREESDWHLWQCLKCKCIPVCSCKYLIRVSDVLWSGRGSILG